MQPVSNSINGGSAAGSLRSAEEFCAAVALALAVFLGASLYKHAWLIDGRGLANATDFVSLWAAGLQTLDGHPAAAYDWTMHKQAEDVALAHATGSYISWAYPPIYLFVGAGLASLPYFAAFASWIALTWSAFALTLRRIIGHQLGLFLAAAFPATWFNVAIGQNGCLTAALMGGTLLLLIRSRCWRAFAWVPSRTNRNSDCCFRLSLASPAIGGRSPQRRPARSPLRSPRGLGLEPRHG